MRNKVLFFTIISLCLLIGETGCGKEEKENSSEELFMSNLYTAPHNIVAKNDMPDWLSDKMNQIEKETEKDIAVIKIRLYQGEWNNKKIYVIINYLSSCLYCDVYYENGEQVIWSKEDITTDSFSCTSENWELIYEYGNGVY